MSGNPKCILLDIEGTTSSINFVYEVMFPYVRQHLHSFLAANWDSDSVQTCLPLLAKELDQADVESWLSKDVGAAQQQVAEGVLRLMDADVKATGLKKLQGAIWKNGFESGQLVAHLFDDVASSVAAWRRQGIDVRIFSSGSVQAQILFFGHTVAGDLLPHFSAHYDTTVGSKKEPASYRAIAEHSGYATQEMLFVSDVTAELDAACLAGMQTVLSRRPGNAPVDGPVAHQEIESFEQIAFAVESG